MHFFNVPFCDRRFVYIFFCVFSTLAYDANSVAPPAEVFCSDMTGWLSFWVSCDDDLGEQNPLLSFCGATVQTWRRPVWCYVDVGPAKSLTKSSGWPAWTTEQQKWAHQPGLQQSCNSPTSLRSSENSWRNRSRNVSFDIRAQLWSDQNKTHLSSPKR